MSDASIQWFPIQTGDVSGLAWPDAELPVPFGRIPARLKEQLREPVYGLSKCSPGVTFEFETQAEAISLRWTREGSGNHANPSDSVLGRHGFDLYGQRQDGHWCWAGAFAPWKEEVTCEMTLNPPGGFRGARRYRLYFPSLRTVVSVEIGVPAGQKIEFIKPDQTLSPILYYGTSIVHGVGASRPGLTFAMQLQRLLDWPLLNFGFSGEAKLDLPLAHLFAELDPALFVIDCLPNLQGHQDEIPSRLAEFVGIIRARHPVTPILLVGNRLFGDAAFIPARFDWQRDTNQVQRKAFLELKKAGDAHIYLTEGCNFFGDDMDGTSDGSHPNDLGNYRMARHMESAIRGVLNAG